MDKIIRKHLSILFLSFIVISCNLNKDPKKNESTNSVKKRSLKSKIDPKDFESVTNGKRTKLFVLKNKNGLEATITNFGLRLVSLMIPDKNGVFKDVVLGFSSLEKYKNNKAKYFGAIIGRYANRIENGTFSIHDTTYNLEKNNGKNHIHGGAVGFNNVVWNARQVSLNKIEFSRTSLDMEEGYPGNL